MGTEFSAEDAILVARAAGLDASALEEQVGHRAKGPDAATLEARIRELEAKVEDQQPTPPDPQPDFAEHYAAALQMAQSRWLGHEEDTDGEAA